MEDCFVYYYLWWFHVVPFGRRLFLVIFVFFFWFGLVRFGLSSNASEKPRLVFMHSTNANLNFNIFRSFFNFSMTAFATWWILCRIWVCKVKWEMHSVPREMLILPICYPPWIGCDRQETIKYKCTAHAYVQRFCHDCDDTPTKILPKMWCQTVSSDCCSHINGFSNEISGIFRSTDDIWHYLWSTKRYWIVIYLQVSIED